MKRKFVSLLVCCLVWGCSGKPTDVFLSYQDSLGQYSFGYSAPGSARSEVKALDGTIRGTYSIVDENGEIQNTQYIADENGFHVIATNLPQEPEETPEVAAARAEHLKALQLAQQKAKEAGNYQDKTILSKEILDQSEEQRLDHHEGLPPMKKVEEMDLHRQELKAEEAKKQLSKEDSLKASNSTALKDRVPVDKVPLFTIIHGDQRSEKNLAIEQGSNATKSPK